MNRKRIDLQWLIIALVGSAFINVIMLPMFAVTARPIDPEEALPPRGTPPATAVPTETPVPAAKNETHSVDGARLQLHVKYGDNWVWNSLAWQDLWTEVEWTDGQNWFVVSGWRGNLDGIEQTDEGDWVSQKEWWVASKDLDTGPFRWVIYQREGGDRLATSDPFSLPTHKGDTTVVDQTIGE